jgi:tetratricopeptide (TPR) repeat protein
VNRFETPVEYTMTHAKISVLLPTRKELNALRIQDKMVLHIVDTNRWRKPIYFAVTVSDDNKMGLEPYLQMQGLAYRILPERVPAEKKIDIDRTVFLLDRVYNFRGLGDGSANLNETSSKLLTNYAAGYVQVAISLRQPLLNLKNEVDSLRKARVGADSARVDTLLTAKFAAYDAMLDLVVDKMDQCVAIMPWEWRWRMLRQEVLSMHGRLDEAEKRAREALVVDPNSPEYLKMLGQVLLQNGKQAQASEIWRRLAAVDQNPWEASMLLARTYEEQKQYDSAIEVMKDFQESHPGDRRAAMLVDRYVNMKKAVVSAAATKGKDS